MVLAAARPGLRRNATTGPAFTPMSLSPSVWMDSTNVPGGVDGSPLASWADSSGNGRLMVQATASKQPVYRSTGGLITPSGKPVVQFDGVDDQIETSSGSTYYNGITEMVFVVVFVNSGTPTDNRITDRVSDRRLLQVDKATGLISHYETNTSNTVTLTQTRNLLDGWHVITALYGNTGKVWVDGVLEFAVTRTGTETLALGTQRIGSDGSGSFLGGRIADYIEFIGGSSAQPITDTQRQQVEAYLRVKHGTP